MKSRVFLLVVFVCCFTTGILGQSSTSGYRPDPIITMSSDLSKISASVQTLTATLKSFVDKFEKVGGITLTEKQQRLVLGMELLTRTEQRVVNLQKSQIELTEKLNSTRNRLGQVEIDLRPRNINNSTTYEGTTETEELRESKRQKLQNERFNLSQLQTQLQNNLNETNEVLRDAMALAERLRRMFLPQIERELYEQQ
ncbi:MAG: hypothetical protein ACKVRN_04210 [Pyrinomonadaceae bacterium]